MKHCTLVVLAAGMGSRYGDLKQIDSIGPNGEILIDYSLHKAVNYFDKIIFIIRKSFEEDFKARISKKIQNKVKIDYAFQEIDSTAKRTKPWGTGQALLEAEHLIDDPFAIINADDFYYETGLKMISNYLKTKSNKTQHAMVGYLLSNTLSSTGGVTRGVCELDKDNNLIGINETGNLLRQEGKIVSLDSGKTFDDKKIVSMNLWGFHPDIFSELKEGFNRFLESYKGDNAEYLIPDIVNHLLSSKKINIKVIKSDDKWFGVTYKEDKEIVVNEIKCLIEKGIYPQRL